MRPRLSSRLTIKGQATIPAKVRATLRLKPGDRLVFEIKGERAMLRKAEPADMAFIKLAEEAFGDWNSPEDEAAFGGL